MAWTDEKFETPEDIQTRRDAYEIAENARSLQRREESIAQQDKDLFEFRQECDAIVPIDDQMPIDALVKPMLDMIRSAAELVQCPVEMAAQVALGMATAVTARAVTVKVGSRSEPTNMWTLIVSPSSERKSIIMSVLQKPLESIEAEMQANVAPKRREWMVRRDALKAKLSEAIRVEAKGKAPIRSPLEIGEELRQHEENEVIIPRFFADDCTPEAMARLLCNHTHLSIMSAEATIVGNMSGKYQGKNAAQDLTFWNKSWSGDKSLIDRADGREMRCNPALSICSMIQTGVLHQLAELQDSRVSGLLSKFLYSVPTSMVGDRISKDFVLPSGHVEGWTNLLKALVHIPVGTVLTLSPDALGLHHEFCNWLESRMGERGQYHHIADWCGKLQSGQQLRIAGLLHCLEHALEGTFPTEISIETQRRAVAFCRFYLASAEKVFEMFSNPHSKLCEKIISYCKRINPGTPCPKTFTRKSIYDGVGDYPEKAVAFKAAEGLLANMGILLKSKEGSGLSYYGGELKKSGEGEKFALKWQPPSMRTYTTTAKPVSLVPVIDPANVEQNFELVF